MVNHLVQLEQEALEAQNSGNLKHAIELFEKIVEENPNYEFGMCFYNIACCLEIMGELEKAKTNYIKAIEYDDEDVNRLGGFASFLYLHGNPKEAFEMHLKLLSLKRKQHYNISNTLIVLKALGQKIGLSNQKIMNLIEKRNN